MNDEDGHPGTPGGDLARFQRGAQDWLVLLSGGVTLGPLSATALLRAWRHELERGRGHRLMAYAITAHGRTVYLVGPHPGAGPRGLLVEGERVSLCGLDERGQPLALRGLPLSRVNGYLFITGRLSW
ncbi:hypothetical protein DAERI_100146 [Deinococcus aerius]|uniref:Uncharacterized protein n=1 Tax=Deinococcus aerius TaxID=200253 RepID=A0A2I9CXH4_9DEIO|nr:hypothetical protein [Deinococcus aerius]GBF06783.1 hypothetical protein DAERI_100146 [Deinococcus aerius]